MQPLGVLALWPANDLDHNSSEERLLLVSKCAVWESRREDGLLRKSYASGFASSPL